MKQLIFSVLLGATALTAIMAHPAAAAEGVVSITLPAGTAQLREGKGKEITNNYCQICHSVDYIRTQAAMPKDKWKTVVVKMKKVFGCPVPDTDIDTIADYLGSAYGPDSPPGNMGDH